jgi:hypothetical protein
MSIPENITIELTSLQAQVTAAVPLEDANHATITALQLNAGNLVADVQAALVAPTVLDTWIAPTEPTTIISGVLDVVTAATDNSDLSLLRGVTGRVAANLDQFT